MKRISTLIALLIVACVSLQAKIVLNSVCTDGMVLQQNAQALIWGTASPDAKITVTPLWGNIHPVKKKEISNRLVFMALKGSL